jgi:PAS domain-containing protein
MATGSLLENYLVGMEDMGHGVASPFDLAPPSAGPGLCPSSRKGGGGGGGGGIGLHFFSAIEDDAMPLGSFEFPSGAGISWGFVADHHQGQGQQGGVTLSAQELERLQQQEEEELQAYKTLGQQLLEENENETSMTAIKSLDLSPALSDSSTVVGDFTPGIGYSDLETPTWSMRSPLTPRTDGESDSGSIEGAATAKKAGASRGAGAKKEASRKRRLEMCNIAEAALSTISKSSLPVAGAGVAKESAEVVEEEGQGAEAGAEPKKPTYYRERNKAYSRNWRNKKKREEEALRSEIEELRNFKMTIEGSMDMVSVHSGPEFCFQYASPGFHRLLSIDPQNLVGLSLSSCVSRNKVALLHAFKEAAMEGACPQDVKWDLGLGSLSVPVVSTIRRAPQGVLAHTRVC